MKEANQINARLLELCKRSLRHLRGEEEEDALDEMGAFEKDLEQAIDEAEGQ